MPVDDTIEQTAEHPDYADVARVLNSCIQFHFGTQHTLRIQKVLEHANVKVASVLSNILGKSGRAMLDAIIDSGDNAAKMREVLAKMANLARKLMCKEVIGFPKEAGYIARGLIRDQFVEKNSGRRLVEMGPHPICGRS